MPAAGAGPNDAQAERITSDDRDDAAPHPSPDGKWLYYLSHPPRTGGYAVDHDVSKGPRTCGSYAASWARGWRGEVGA
jgi:Tol biopolymer transport system component